MKRVQKDRNIVPQALIMKHFQTHPDNCIETSL